MGKRTAQTGMLWDEAQDLDELIQDKRSGKRANSAKGRRRKRRYENRLSHAVTIHYRLHYFRHDITMRYVLVLSVIRCNNFYFLYYKALGAFLA